MEALINYQKCRQFFVAHGCRVRSHKTSISPKGCRVRLPSKKPQNFNQPKRGRVRLWSKKPQNLNQPKRVKGQQEENNFRVTLPGIYPCSLGRFRCCLCCGMVSPCVENTLATYIPGWTHCHTVWLCAHSLLAILETVLAQRREDMMSCCSDNYCVPRT